MHYNRLAGLGLLWKVAGKKQSPQTRGSKQAKAASGARIGSQRDRSFRYQLWPLLCTLRRELKAQITAEEKQLEAITTGNEKALAAESELNEKMQSNVNQQTRLEVKSEEFTKRRIELAGLLQEVDIETDLSSPEKAEDLLNVALPAGGKEN